MLSFIQDSLYIELEFRVEYIKRFVIYCNKGTAFGGVTSTKFTRRIKMYMINTIIITLSRLLTITFDGYLAGCYFSNERYLILLLFFACWLLLLLLGRVTKFSISYPGLNIK